MFLDLNSDDVVWIDECTVQLESHRCFSSSKIGQRAKVNSSTYIKHPQQLDMYEPVHRPKYPTKVHVGGGGGISL